MIKFVKDLFLYFFAIYGLIRVLLFYKRRSLPKLEKASISIVIPARNEEKRLPKLLESIKNQKVKPLEVIVVDDGSEDYTDRIALNYNAKVIHVSLPPGWVGKSYACYIGAKEAKGEVILFLDADVVLSEDFLEKLGGKISDRVVFSIQPYHRVIKFYEHFSLYFNLVSLLGVIGRKFDSVAYYANGLFGPCLFIPKNIYEETGGHALVKNSVVEDLELGVELRKKGIQVVTLPHFGLISYRMYEGGIMNLIRGWIKNFAKGALKTHYFNLLQVVGIVATSFMCFVNFFKVKTSPLSAYIYLSGYLFYTVLVYLALRKIGSAKVLDIALWPVHSVFFTIIFLLSVIFKILGVRVPWKGRRVQ